MKKIRIALAGNANVGKSVIFNYLTGLHQHIGNWPGKTVEKAEGTLNFQGYIIDVIDLPGIYSLSTFSIEEIISREYIANEKPDVIINVVDASVLERNLFFTIQLLEMETPMIIALNQIDIAKQQGETVDHKKLQKLLGVPVIPTIAVKGLGIGDLLKEAIKMFEGRHKIKPVKLRYGREIEKRIEKLTKLVKKIKSKYPARWVAIKLLEDDEEIKRFVKKIDSKITSKAKKYSRGIEKIHSHLCPTAIVCERYAVAGRITKKALRRSPIKTTLSERIHHITTHKIFGYVIMIALILSIFYIVFSFGDFFSNILTEIFINISTVFEKTFGSGVTSKLIWSLIEGVAAGITVVLPYIIPFYLVLGTLEDTGYLSRIAFLMDNLMHKIGLHGKAFIPLMLGYGCNVPACLGCRIMETHRERLIAVFVTTLIPCAAVTTIILGLVGKYVSLGWAIFLYIINLIIVFILGRIAFKVLPGEPTGLIMEMHSYKIPHLKTLLKKTWFRVKDFTYIAFPLIILGTFFIQILEITNLLSPIENLMAPVTVYWLGLPSIVGILLIFGILRKELTLVMLAALIGTTNFAIVLTPVQMIVLSLVTMLYIPCIATVAAMIKEIGWKRSILITVFEILFAIAIGGIAYRLLILFF